MFLNKLNKISDEYTGAIDKSYPFLCRYAGKDNLLKALNGNTDDYRWASISAQEAESIKIATLMYVKFIYVGDAKSFRIKSNFVDSGLLIPVSICGILVQSILFLKDKYKKIEGSYQQLNTSDQAHIRQFDVDVNNCTLCGNFNLKTCTYYCELG